MCVAWTLCQHSGGARLLAKDTVAIKFEDNQAKGAPNQLKTEYDGRAC